MIKKEGDKWVLYSKDGSKKLGEYDSEEKAKEREKQVQAFKHMKEGEAEGAIHFLEGKDEEGAVWRVRLIAPGFSKNRGATGHPRYYPPATLQAATPLFEGVRAFAHRSGQHVKSVADRTSWDVVGWFSDPAFDRGITADFTLVNDTLRTTVREAFKRGKRDLLGFSIDGEGREEVGVAEGRQADIVTSISKVHSTDVVPDPAAGGEFVRLVAAEEDTNVKDKLLELIRKYRPKLLEGKDDAAIAAMTEAEAEALLQEAMKEPEQPKADPKADGDGDGDGKGKLKEADLSSLQGVEKRLRAIEASERRVAVREAVAAHALAQYPASRKHVETRLLAALDRGAELDEASIKAELDKELEYVGALSGTGKVTGLGESRGRVLQEERDKWQKAMDGLFAGQAVDKVSPFRSMKEAYLTITRTPYLEYNPQNVIRESVVYIPRTEYGVPFRESVAGKRMSRLFESIASSDWGEMLGDSITRRMVAEYSMDDLQTWRQVVSDLTSVTDFRTQRRMRMGGYGTLPTVGQGGTYPPLTSPGDEEATFAPSKRGGVDDLTLETIANDDVGAVRRIPQKLGRAAARTLYNFVWNTLISTNANIYDGSALAVAGHNNLGSTALSAATLTVAIQAMRNQAGYGDTSEILGGVNKPKFLVIPNELEELAYKLTVSAVMVQAANYNATEPNYFLTYGIRPLVVDSWTDADNWWLIADPARIPTIELGFFNGQQEPELFVQDQPTVGSVFSADKITYKIRHIYGGAVLDFRGFYGAIVS